MAFPGNITTNNGQVIDPVLTNLIQGYKLAGTVIDKVFYRLPVDIYFGRVPKMGGEHLRLQNSVAIGRAATPEMTYSVTATDSYEIIDHRLKTWSSRQDWVQFGGQTRAIEMVNYMLADNLLLGREYAFAKAMQDVTVITQNSAPTYGWDDNTNSTPLSDAAYARAQVKAGCGYPPNTAIMSWEVYNVLRSSKQLLNYALAFYGISGASAFGSGLLNDNQLALVLGVDRIMVGGAMYNTAEGGQTQSLSSVWGKNCIFAYINPSPNPNMAQQSLGYSFVPSASSLEGGYETYAYTMPEYALPPMEGLNVYQGRMYDDHILDAKCAYLYTAVIS
jgi:hypothetical protein